MAVALEHVACLYAAAKFDDAKASLQATFASVPVAYVDNLIIKHLSPFDIRCPPCKPCLALPIESRQFALSPEFC